MRRAPTENGNSVPAKVATAFLHHLHSILRPSLSVCTHLRKVITPEILECYETRDMCFHGFRVKVTKGDQVKNFIPEDAYRVLAMNCDKPTGALLLLRDEKGELRRVSIGDVRVHSIDLPR